MKILVLGDPHISKSTLNQYKYIFEEIYELIDTMKPDLFVSLGDTLHMHERVDMRCLCAANEFYLNVAKKCKCIILIGNHDRENNRDYMSEIHPFTALSHCNNITVVDKTHVFEFESNKFIFVPYVPNGKFHDALGEVGYFPLADESKNKIVPHLIFAHQEFKGAKLSKNIVSTKGDPWPTTNTPPIISGHLHDFSQHGNIIYVGTPFQQDYDESPDKALMQIDIDISKSLLNLSRIPLTSTIKKVTVNLLPENLANFSSYLPANNVVPSKDVNLKGKTLTKVVITADSNDVKAIKASSYYKSLVDSVDKVDLKVTNTKTNLAASYIKQEGPEMMATLEEIAKKMIGNDDYMMAIFNKICS